MSVGPQWEYLTVLVSSEILDYEEIHPKSVNGQELKNWKKIDLNTLRIFKLLSMHREC